MRSQERRERGSGCADTTELSWRITVGKGSFKAYQILVNIVAEGVGVGGERTSGRDGGKQVAMEGLE
jgi:hypothetical protein